MAIVYQSTRDASNKVTASQAILKGLADDGGLFTPITFPKVDLDFTKLKDASYQEVAKLVLSAFFDDFTEQELDYCISQAYDTKFDTTEIAPIVKIGDRYHLELFHGPTIAFKDMALSILPYLLTTTSGDTGKAAMAGFADVPGTEIIVFYPKNGVSYIQELQMITQAGQNTHVVAIEGNFDDAQTSVKEMFNNSLLRSKLSQQHMQLSSANSMNMGRLVPQIVYYIYAYAQLVKSKEISIGQPINFSVPTGNFGNILAAYYASQIGLPVTKLICASNDNNVLTDFFKTQTYDKNREFKVTSSPSMDILVSSNLERLIFHLLGDDAETTKKLMEDLVTTGEYALEARQANILESFVAGFATEQFVELDIKRLFDQYQYIEDPHTAVASAVYQAYQTETKDQTPTVIVSTASPYKFPSVVTKAITNKEEIQDFAAISILNDLSGVSLPKAVTDLQKAEVIHRTVVPTSNMRETVEECLGLKQ